MKDLVTRNTDAAADIGRPRVLLADDDAEILQTISRMLGSDFEVVATVADGREALDAVACFDPDVVVLDISMPPLDGFQTAAKLQRLGSRVKIVFLTMHQDDDFVAKALGSGAMGYVLNTLASSDLGPALLHALDGRHYLPSLAPLVMTDTDTHAVQFHGGDSSWLDRAADALSMALLRGDIVATALIETNRDALAVRMNERGWNLAELRAIGRYVVVDAEDAATQVMRGGQPHLNSIAEMVTALEKARTASPSGRRAHLTIVGEIGVILCRRGSHQAALELERLWDELTRSHPILTICVYPMGCFDHHGAAGLVSGISAHHSVISHTVSSGRQHS